ncbi:hypothetical protein CHUAL_005960 [Chamberlinius hualienensis]
MASTDIEEEVESLRREFRWLLSPNGTSGLIRLREVIVECSRRFHNPQSGAESLVKSEKFIMSTPNPTASEQIKCMVTLTADNVSQADITVKVHKNSSQVYKTTVPSDSPWKLQQVQDAGNHLQSALKYVVDIERGYEVESADKIIHLLSEVMKCLKHGLRRLLVPQKRSIQELQNSSNVKHLQPPLPPDLTVSFYVQAHKLIFAVYHVQHVHGSTKFDVYQSECSVPWLNEVLALFSFALQLCQQFKGKVDVFSKYGDLGLLDGN